MKIFVSFKSYLCRWSWQLADNLKTLYYLNKLADLLGLNKLQKILNTKRQTS